LTFLKAFTTAGFRRFENEAIPLTIPLTRKNQIY